MNLKANAPRWLSYLGVFTTCMILEFQVFGFQCPNENFESAFLKTKTVAERSNLVLEQDKKLKNLASSVFDEYLSSRLNGQLLEECLKGSPARGDLTLALQSVFFRRSLEFFRASSSQVLNRFYDLYISRFGTSLPLFRLTGHEVDLAPDEDKGGFHRGERSIFIDFARIPANEWFIIFAHEMLHNLDPYLWKGVENYAKQDFLKTWLHQGRSYSSLSGEEIKILNRWIEAGMDRGLFAEYRAWMGTITIYRKGLREGYWKPIDWLESKVPMNARDEDLRQLVFEKLDRRHSDPQVGSFGSPLVKEALERFRNSYRTSHLLPTLDGFPGLF